MLWGLLVAAASPLVVASVGIPDVVIAPGVKMPMIAFGTNASSLKGECTVADAVEQWLRLGGRHIDTANSYHTEADIGRALRASGVSRSEVFLTTKIEGPIGKQAAIDTILQSSLPQLGVEYIDLVLIHYPCKALSDFPNKCAGEQRAERLDTWQGLLELQRAGKIRAAGVSNYLAEQVAEIVSATGSGPAVNQVEWHLGYHNETLRSAMAGDNVTLEAWGSLAGPTTDAGHPGVPLSDPRLADLAQRRNVSAAQLALRWSAHKGVVPVTATCSKAHAMGDLATFAFDLSEEEVARLDGLAPQLAERFVL